MSDLIGVWLRASEPLRFAQPAIGTSPAAYRLKIIKVDGELCSFDSQIKRTPTSSWELRSTGICVPLDHMLDEIEMGNLRRE